MHKVSILDQTRNFIDLHVYAAGRWKTPSRFHRWAAISLLAALVEDRVWLNVLDHEPLHPNIWTFLIGGSGVGKDHAIGFALSHLRDEDHLCRIDGKVTAPGLYDWLEASQKKSGRSSAPFYLITSDVSEQLPLGPEAKDFTSRVLALYGGRSRVFVDITRGSGTKSIRNPLGNWVAGCTPKWFPNAIDPMIFSSGYIGRSAFIFGEPDMDYFHLSKPALHHDTPEVLDHLRRRVEMYLAIEGLFAVAPEAKIIHDAWLIHLAELARRGDLTDIDRETIGRIKTTAEKLSMIFALADWEAGLLIITGDHMKVGINEAEGLMKGARIIAEFAFSNSDSDAAFALRDLIRNVGEITHQNLVRGAMKRGITGRRLKELIEDLVTAGLVIQDKRKPSSKGGPWPKIYRWAPGRLVRLGKTIQDDDGEVQGG